MFDVSFVIPLISGNKTNITYRCNRHVARRSIASEDGEINMVLAGIFTYSLACSGYLRLRLILLKLYSALPCYPPPVILLDTAGSMQRLDSATSLRAE
jgi:hypothetical protein